MEAIIALLVLATFCGAVMATLRFMRSSPRRRGWGKDGVYLGEEGFEFPRFYIFGKVLVPYQDIKSVRITTWWEALKGANGVGVFALPFRDVVVIEVSGLHFVRRWMVTPLDPLGFVDSLKRRLEPNQILEKLRPDEL